MSYVFGDSLSTLFPMLGLQDFSLFFSRRLYKILHIRFKSVFIFKFLISVQRHVGFFPVGLCCFFQWISLAKVAPLSIYLKRTVPAPRNCFAHFKELIGGIFVSVRFWVFSSAPR